MLSQRQLKKRIRSIENTRKIARAMEVISVTKLRRIEDRVAAMRPYVEQMDEILGNVIATIEDFKHPLMDERKEKNHIAVCVVTSDSGLCGVYNNNILRTVEGFLRQQEDKVLQVIPVGKRGFSYFKNRGFAMPRTFVGLNGRYNELVIDEITAFLQDLFLTRKADEVYVVYTHFETTVRHHPTIEKFLNITPMVSATHRADFIWEPSQSRIFAEAIPEYLILKMRSFILQSFACEHSLRIIAMSMAKQNSMELLEKLILLQNKTRQAAITKEILEVVSAAEALKG